MADSSAGSTMKPRVMTKTQKRTRYIAVTAMLSAIATVLMYIEIVVPFMPSFIKLDLSDLPSLIGSFAMGPVYGVVIAAVKNLLHLFFTSSGGVGELSNFLLNAAFVLPAGLIYRFRKSKKGAIAGALTGAVVMAALSVPINYFIVYPYGCHHQDVSGYQSGDSGWRPASVPCHVQHAVHICEGHAVRCGDVPDL